MTDDMVVKSAAAVTAFALIRPADRLLLPADLTDAYPLSQAQLGVIVEMLADADPNLHHSITSLRIRDDKPFAAWALEPAVRAVVARHDALRTSIHLTGYSVPLQLVHAEANPVVHLWELTGLDDAGQRAALREFTRRQRQTPFDLSTAPLVRVSGHECDDGWWMSITECPAVLEDWSCQSLLLDVLEAYHRIRDGRPPSQPPDPSVRYADFIAAEIAGTTDAADREHWRSLVAAYPKLALPPSWGAGPDGPRSVRHTWIPLGHLDGELRATAATMRASVKSVLLAAHLKVMSMLTDEETFFTGLVCDGRPEAPGAERVCGRYFNTLPFSYDRGARTWRELVGAVFAQEASVWAHRQYPTAEIQREFGPGRRLLEVRFGFLDLDQADIDLDAGIHDSRAEFGLAVNVLAGQLLLAANPQVISEANMERLAGMYRQVVAAILTDPDGDATAAYLPPGELQQLLDAQDRTSTAPELSVREMFEAQALATPDQTAVTFDGAVLSYAELDARANQYAHRLRAAGLGPEDVVGVLLDRGLDLIACLLGAWKVGAAYLPLDVSFPAERIADMLADSGARLLLTQRQYADRAAVAALIVVDVADPDIRALPRTAVGVPAGPDQLAYLIFTSGSTGRPKGVQITHRGLANHVAWAARTLIPLGAGGTALFSSHAFDLVVPNIWAPLAAGRPVHLMPADLDPADLGHELSEAGPFAFIKLTPGHLEALRWQLSAAEAAALVGGIVVAGEALPAELADHWLGWLGPGRLINEYGPTEASVGSTILAVDEPADSEIVPIGRPLPGMTVVVLDARMQPVPIGVTGELYVGGIGVARGYVGRPGLTAEQFVPDPYGPPGARLYRTGDSARLRANGVVEFVGRVDDQVKIRGYRVEPGEIAAVLRDHEGVRDCAVLAAGVAPNRRLVAFYVPDGPVDDASLARHCGALLPPYLVPTAFVALDQLPLNANGKVDRAALAALPPPGAAPRGIVEPRTALERRIAEVWCTVLELDRVGVHDGFFDVGGHSIQTLSLVGALRAAKLGVTVRDVFEYRTIAELAEAIQARAAPA